MSRALLLNPPGVLHVLPPLGMLYMAAVLEQNGIDVKVVDCAVKEYSWDQVRETIEDEDPEILGTTVTTPGSVNNKKLIQIAKEVNPKIKTVYGGPHATVLPDDCLKNENLDFVIRGEGEFAFLQLTNSLLNKKMKLAKISNLSFKQDGRIFHNPRGPIIMDLDSLPFPARHFVPIKKYSGVVLPRKHPETQIMATRGCPFRCRFCSKAVFGSTFRTRNPINVVDEIEYLVDTYGIKTINFYDDGVNYNPAWTIKMCDEMIARGLDDEIEWKAQVRVNKHMVTYEMLKKMREAGCWLLCWGIESGDPGILKLITKDITLEEAKRAIKMCSDVGIRSLAYFMAGNIGETIETVEKTIKFAIELSDYGLDFPQLSLGVPYPGTDFYEIAKQNGWIIAKAWDDYAGDKRSVVVKMPGLPDKYLENCFSIMYKRYYLRLKYVLRQITKIRSKDDLLLIKKGIQQFLYAILTRVPYANKLQK